MIPSCVSLSCYSSAPDQHGNYLTSLEPELRVWMTHCFEHWNNQLTMRRYTDPGTLTVCPHVVQELMDAKLLSGIGFSEVFPPRRVAFRKGWFERV